MNEKKSKPFKPIKPYDPNIWLRLQYESYYEYGNN